MIEKEIKGKTKVRMIAGAQFTILFLSTFAFAFLVYAASPVSASTTLSGPSSCCEKTKTGAYCVNADESKCNGNYQVSQTSCETTSYCKLGTCYDSSEGICMENTPQNVCTNNGGTWDERPLEEVPQCQLGCCIIADQAAFVSLVRCKRLSSFFGVENNYKTDITSEIQCIATAQSQDRGACVYDKDYERTCKFTTRGDCNAPENVETVNGTTSGKTFYKDYLCSAEELNTICARQTSTTCYDGKVLWTDSCGNKENVYSSNKDKSWNNGRVLSDDSVCASNDGTNKECGNCDYMLGSRCAPWTGVTGMGKPSSSDNYCKRTECVDEKGQKRINGESWCIYDGEVGNGKDKVGSRYFREICIDGKIEVEPCAEYRNEVCLEGSITTSAGEYGTSACRVNRWQDCVLQTEKDDCLNPDKRDCMWTSPVTGMALGSGVATTSQSGTFSNPTAGEKVSFTNPTATGGVVAPITGGMIAPITGEPIFGSDETSVGVDSEDNTPGVCVPSFPPGLKFWDESSATQICSQASAKCTVVKSAGLLGGESVKKGEECLDEDWAMEANKICASLGDCGGYVNYIGVYTDDGYEWKVDGKKKEFSPNALNKVKGGFTGMVVGMLTGSVVMTGMDVGKDPGNEEGGNGALALSGVGLAPTVKDIISPPPAPSTTLNNIQVASGVSSNSNVYYTTQELVAKGADGKSIIIPKGSALPSGSNGEEIAFGNYKITDPTDVQTIAKYSTKGKPSSTLSKLLGQGGGSGWDALATGAQWAAIAYGAGYLIGSLTGMSSQNTQALSTALAAGTFTWKFLATYNFNAGGMSQLSFLGTGAGSLITGLGVGAIVFLMMYKKTSTEIVSFDCLPWQAPTGGNNCEKCNSDTLPCSEYRCKSLGQNCEIVNAGTTQEKCVNVNPKDVNQPVIYPNENEITNGYKFTNVRTSPPGPGFDIVSSESNGCLKAFTPLKFGINVNEPAQCKIDFNHTTSFDQMTTFFGGSNIYSYNHTEQFSLPGAKAFENSSLVLENGKDFLFYIRCKDKNGNENSAEYAVKMCVDPSPDTTAPEIKATSVSNNGCVAEDTEEADVNFYTNEPADCKWSFQDKGYENMENDMSCSDELYQVNANMLFTCAAKLNGIARDGTKYYVRCEDQPGAEAKDRNNMKESFEFSLRGSTGLKLDLLMPNGTIQGAVNPAPVELYAKTLFGCNNGQSICYYSTTDKKNDYIMFYDTNNEDGISTQRQDLTDGGHKYYVQCIDAGGNLAKSTIDFNLNIDTSSATVARVYQEADTLKVVTVRDGECSYSLNNCDFSFEEGTLMPYSNSTTHIVEWNKERTYYIKCRDAFRNEEADCSLVVKPSDNFM